MNLGHRAGWCLLTMALLGNAGLAQSVIVQVLDGRTGKPVRKGTVVQIAFPDEPIHRLLGLHTDHQGEVEFDAQGAKDFQLGAVGYVPCDNGGTTASVEKFSVEEVLQSGLRSSNHCGQAYPQSQPGRLMYFVKPEGLWDKFKNSG